MPSKYPILKPSEVIKKIEKKGFVFISQKGSHKKYSDGVHVAIIPMHDEIAKGTLKSILHQCELSLEEFMTL